MVSLVVVWNGPLSQREPCASAAICGFIASRSVYVFTLEVSWQRFLVFLWLKTERGGETEREREREREI